MLPSPGILFVEKDLAMEVVHRDTIPVDDPQPAHAGAGQQIRQRAAQGSATTDEHVAGGQPPLALGSE